VTGGRFDLHLDLQFLGGGVQGLDQQRVKVGASANGRAIAQREALVVADALLNTIRTVNGNGDVRRDLVSSGQRAVAADLLLYRRHAYHVPGVIAAS